MESVHEIEGRLLLQPLCSLKARLSHSRRLERAWLLIQRDYTDVNLSLMKAARMSGISKNHLNVRCRQASSFTFHQLLTRYRLSQAIVRMKAKNDSLLEIALESGFGSLSSFQRNFRSVMGVSPGNFRRIGISAEQFGISKKT